MLEHYFKRPFETAEKIESAHRVVGSNVDECFVARLCVFPSDSMQPGLRHPIYTQSYSYKWRKQEMHA